MQINSQQANVATSPTEAIAFEADYFRIERDSGSIGILEGAGLVPFPAFGLMTAFGGT